MLRGSRILKLATVCVAWLLAAGCASGLDGARQAITRAEQAQIATIDALTTYSRDYQDATIAPLLAQTEAAEQASDPVKAASYREQATAAIVAFRGKRARAVNALMNVGLVTAEARVTLELVAQGTKQPADLNNWLTALAGALADAQTIYAELAK